MDAIPVRNFPQQPGNDLRAVPRAPEKHEDVGGGPFRLGLLQPLPPPPTKRAAQCSAPLGARRRRTLRLVFGVEHTGHQNMSAVQGEGRRAERTTEQRTKSWEAA